MVALLGCSKVIGIDDYSVAARSGTGGATSGNDAGSQYRSRNFAFSFTSRTCRDCADRGCDQQEKSCADDADCNAWARCRAACSDAKCIAQCPRRVPRAAGAPATTDYGTCLHANCADSCVKKNDGIDEALSPTCYDCVQTQCGNSGGNSFACVQGPCADKCQPDWSCVGHVEWPKPLALPAGADFAIVTKDQGTGAEIPGGTIRACSGFYADCTMPIGGPTTTNDAGVAALKLGTPPPLAQGLFDYFEFELSGYIPTMTWMTPPPVRAGADQRTQVRTSAGMAAPELDLANFGIVAVYHVDCDGSAAADIVMDVSYSDGSTPPTTRYYAGVTLDGSAHHTDASATSVAFNVKPGPIVVSARRFSDNVLVSKQAAQVRAGWGTFFLLPPTPLAE